MASRKQLDANRRNARRSTGPSSIAGKLQSRQNAWKHGLAAQTLVFGSEDPARFEEMRSELMTQHDPQTALECELVERLAGILWRLRRVPAFEAAILEARQAQVEQEDIQKEWDADILDRDRDEQLRKSEQKSSVLLGRALIKDGNWNDALGKLARHEATLMSAFTKTLQMLLLLQSGHAQRADTLVIEEVPVPTKER